MTWKPEIPDFEPVQLRARAGGWTAARQRGFLEALAETANVQAAARCVGLTARAAYLLRGRDDATSFREAWDEVVENTNCEAYEAAMSRAINGTMIPIFYRGIQVGERRRDHDGLLINLLRRGDRLMARQ